MDWDDPKPKTTKAIEVGEPLAALSIGELLQRIAAHKAEIARIEQELARKQAVQSAAKAAFKT